MAFNYKSKIFMGGMAILAFSLLSVNTGFAACIDVDGNDAFHCDMGGTGTGTGVAEGPTTGTLSVQLSPGVGLSYQSDVNGAGYAVRTENFNVPPEKRNAYGFASDYSGYYQMLTNATLTQTITNVLLTGYGTNPPSSLFTDPWTPMGGDAGGGS